MTSDETAEYSSPTEYPNRRPGEPPGGMAREVPPPVNFRWTQYQSLYRIGDRVRIDHHADMIGIVLAVQFRWDEGQMVQVGWIHAGAAHEAWFPTFRLEK